MSNAQLSDLVVKLSTDPFNPELNFEAANTYYELKQTASAVSFYLRTAEYGYESHPLLVYASLLRMSICLETQSDRVYSVSNNILQAIAYMPTRPEGYFLLSRFYEKCSNWQECYTIAEIGACFSKQRINPLPVDIGYASYVFDFEKAASAWWIGQMEESKELFIKLSQQSLPPEYVVAITNNLNMINGA